jgi:hypothetical protein
MPPKPRFIPAIRSMQEARDALAEVLEMNVRRMQIIVIMQKIMICRTPDTRRFLGDAMAGLIEGGLDYMRKKRREAIEAIQRKEAEERARLSEKERREREEAERRQREYEERRRRELEEQQRLAAEREAEEARRRAAVEFEPMELVDSAPIEPGTALPEEGVGVEIPDEEPAPAVDLPPEPEPLVMPEREPEPEPEPEPPPPPPEPEPEPIVILPSPEEMKEIEELGTELDALSLAAVAREIFPELKTAYEPWEVGRAIYMDEKSAREAVLQGARLKDHERATMLAPAFDNMKRLIENFKPWWSSSLPAIRECIDEHFATHPEREGGATAQQVFDVMAMSDKRAVDMLKLIAKTNEPGVAYSADVRSKLDKLMLIEGRRDS